jgi:hypothetical protein
MMEVYVSYSSKYVTRENQREKKIILVSKTNKKMPNCMHNANWTILKESKCPNYWVSVYCQSSGILNTRISNVSETGSVYVLS